MVTANYISQDTSVGDDDFWTEFFTSTFEDEEDYHDQYGKDEEDHEVVSYGGILMRYKAWMIGPVIKYFPNSSDSIAFEFSLLYGRIFDGTITAFPSRRDYGETFDEHEYITDIRGDQFFASTALVIGRYSFGVSYQLTRLKLKHEIGVYENLGTSTNIHTFLFFASAGLYF